MFVLSYFPFFLLGQKPGYVSNSNFLVWLKSQFQNRCFVFTSINKFEILEGKCSIVSLDCRK